jgi:hypothetical protein
VVFESPDGGFAQVGSACHSPAHPPAVTQGIQTQTSHDAEEPRGKAGARLVRGPVTIDPQEDFLTEVFGQVMIANQGVKL